MKRNYVLATLALFALTAPAGAVVVPFDISPDVPIAPAGVIPGGAFIGGQFTYYNIQFSVDGGATDINLRTSRAIDGGTPDQVTSDGYNGSSVVIKGDNSFLNAPFAAGEAIGDGLNEFQRAPDQFSVLYDGGTTSYMAGTNYLGLRLTSGNYAYVNVDYNPIGSIFTFTGGAYETSGAAITAGAVPEAATSGLAAIAALFAGKIGRRRKQAA
jgi:hypothetical protein